jgi:hypothetical protein
LAQKRKSSPTIHHPFDELNPGDLAFRLSIVVRECESSQDSRFVSLDSVGKTVEFWNRTSTYLCQPTLKLLASSLADHLQKLLHQLVDGLDRFTCLTEGFEFCSLLLVKIIERTDKEPDRRLCLKMV